MLPRRQPHGSGTVDITEPPIGRLSPATGKIAARRHPNKHAIDPTQSYQSLTILTVYLSNNVSISRRKTTTWLTSLSVECTIARVQRQSGKRSVLGIFLQRNSKGSKAVRILAIRIENSRKLWRCRIHFSRWGDHFFTLRRPSSIIVAASECRRNDDKPITITKSTVLKPPSPKTTRPSSLQQQR